VDWVRVVMHRETERLVRALEPANLDAFEVSGRKWQNFGFRSYKNAWFPELDICKDPPKGTYDIVFAEQVWEHLPYPYRATKHVLKMLRPGGYFLVTVPVLIKYHPAPADCSRWTAQGLAYFLEECGFDPANTVSASWGNRACLIANLDKWVKYDADQHDLANEEKYPLVAWALAKRT